MEALWRLARNLFPGTVELDVQRDPEIPELTTLDFQVTARGTVSVILDHESEWHRHKLELAGDFAHLITLSIDPQLTRLE